MTTLSETSDHNRINTHQDSERTSVAALHRGRSKTHKYIFHLYIKARDIYLSLINQKKMTHICHHCGKKY